MKTAWKSLGLSVLIALSLSPLVATPASAANSTGDVVSQINAIRVQNGLAPLISRTQLTASAQSYAMAMATGKFFAHVSPTGSTLVTRNEAAGYTNWTFLEENLAAGQTTVTAAVNAWMQSPTHRADILSPRVTDTGVGYVYVAGSPYGHYWVQEFGTRTVAVEKAPAAIAAPPVVAATATVKPRPVVPSPTAVVAAPPVLATLKNPSASTPVATEANPVLEAPIVATDQPRPAFVREQRDPDNLNLYLIQYRTLGK